MLKRQHTYSGSPFESKIGISRAIRAGNIIAITGTAPIGEDGNTAGIGDAAAQARRCFEIIESALKDLDSSLEDVIRTRIILINIEDWEKVAEVHGDFFREIQPANIIMEISRFVNPEWLVEIEADAVVSR